MSNSVKLSVGNKVLSSLEKTENGYYFSFKTNNDEIVSIDTSNNVACVSMIQNNNPGTNNAIKWNERIYTSSIEAINDTCNGYEDIRDIIMHILVETYRSASKHKTYKFDKDKVFVERTIKSTSMKLQKDSDSDKYIALFFDAEGDEIGWDEMKEKEGELESTGNNDGMTTNDIGEYEKEELNSMLVELNERLK